ncbi:MAG: cytochrome bd-I oxidase subunit CydX [Rudaea sp.]
MWYFTWILGLGFACAFGILNAIWLEVHADSRSP